MKGLPACPVPSAGLPVSMRAPCTGRQPLTAACWLQEITYHSCDAGLTEHGDSFQPDEAFLNTLSAGGLPPHKLTLKLGTIVMLLRNFDSSRGLANGTRLIVTGLGTRLLVCKTTDAAQTTVLLPKLAFSPSDRSFGFKFSRRQFPVRPAFAMSMNKSQGQTLARMGLFLPSDPFGHGQVYVSFSRVGSRDRITVQVVHGTRPDRPGSFSRNIVYHDILV